MPEPAPHLRSIHRWLRRRTDPDAPRTRTLLPRTRQADVPHLPPLTALPPTPAELQVRARLYALDTRL